VVTRVPLALLDLHLKLIAGQRISSGSEVEIQASVPKSVPAITKVKLMNCQIVRRLPCATD
jgi:hypothetical protein